MVVSTKNLLTNTHLLLVNFKRTLSFVTIAANPVNPWVPLPRAMPRNNGHLHRLKCYQQTGWSCKGATGCWRSQWYSKAPKLPAAPPLTTTAYPFLVVNWIQARIKHICHLVYIALSQWDIKSLEKIIPGHWLITDKVLVSQSYINSWSLLGVVDFPCIA